MKTLIFIIIVLVSGASAGLIHGVVNFAIVEPSLDRAISIENQNLFDSGEEQDTMEFQIQYEQYRIWQKGGQIFAGVILGTSVGALFGIVFALSKNSLPGNHIAKRSLVLAGIMWCTLYFIPFLKYPANPPTVGDADTIVLRVMLYVSFIILSGVATIAFYKLAKRLKNYTIGFLGYGIFISILFILMPANPDEITAPINLVNEFRVMSVLGVCSFWVSVGAILGLLWHHFEPLLDIERT